MLYTSQFYPTDLIRSIVYLHEWPVIWQFVINQKLQATKQHVCDHLYDIM